jgi:hypothetical protein
MSKYLKLPFLYYIIGIFLIILYPPYNLTSVAWEGKTISTFQGWDFIWNLGNVGISRSYELNVTYFLLEIGILTLCLGVYIIGTKK